MYSIRYGILAHDRFSDRVIVYNPNYGTPIGPYGSRPVKPDREKLRRLGSFYAELEASIKKEGIRNPLFCNTFEGETYCKYGTSRLFIAKKFKLQEVPAIIADYDGIHSDLEELHTEQDIVEKYTDVPSIVEIDDTWMRIDACRQ